MVKIKVISFGVFKEILPNELVLEFEHSLNLNDLRENIVSQFPEVNKITFTMAVNHQIINENIEIKDSDIVAIMPPFSGG